MGFAEEKKYFLRLFTSMYFNWINYTPRLDINNIMKDIWTRIDITNVEDNWTGLVSSERDIPTVAFIASLFKKVSIANSGINI